MAALVSNCKLSGPRSVMPQHDAILKFVTGTSLAMDLEDFPTKPSEDALLPACIGMTRVRRFKYISKSSMAVDNNEEAPPEPAPGKSSWFAEASGLMKVIMKEMLLPSGGGPMCQYTFAESEVPCRPEPVDSDAELELALQLSLDEATSNTNIAKAPAPICQPQVIGRAFD